MCSKDYGTVSVILPIFNVEKFIPYTLESLKKQTYRHIEIILVNDGTQDNSVEVAEKILKQTDFAYKFIHQENSGQGSARNAGMDQSSGEWVYFLDTDDTIHPETFERMLEVGCTENPDFIFSDFKCIENYKIVEELPNAKTVDNYSAQEIQLAFLKRKVIILAPGTLYRRSFLKDNLLRFETIPWSEDQHFIWKVLSCVKKATYLREPLYYYYQREGSIMHATPISRMIQSYQKIQTLPKLFEKTSPIASLIVPRWVLGCLHVVASRNNANDWETIWQKLDGKRCLISLLHFPDIRVKLISIIGLMNRKMLFVILK